MRGAIRLPIQCVLPPKKPKIDLNDSPQIIQDRARASLIQSISSKSICGWAGWLSSIAVWGDPASGSEMSVSQRLDNHSCVSSTCILSVLLRSIRTCLCPGQSQTYVGCLNILEQTPLQRATRGTCEQADKSSVPEFLQVMYPRTSHCVASQTPNEEAHSAMAMGNVTYRRHGSFEASHDLGLGLNQMRPTDYACISRRK